IFMLWLTTIACLAGTPARVLDVRLSKSPTQQTQVIFDLNQPVKHTIFSLKKAKNKPDRLVIDLENAKLVSEVEVATEQAPLLSKIRTAPRNKKDLRVVLDLKRPANNQTYTLKPSGRYGHRLVVALTDTQPKIVQAKTLTIQSTPRTAYFAPPVTNAPIARHPQGGRNVVVAIDAGHGGIDPGAIGKKGTQEKDVVLDISRHLYQMVLKEPGMQPAMIRVHDEYLSLRGRIKRARQAGADIFISIHADAYKNSKVRGSSVYVLSRKGASSEAAKWLAKRENASDLLGGVSLSDKDDVLASILLDLSQMGTSEASVHLANSVLNSLSRIGPLHRRSVQHAAFMVLRSPDIPSILVETAFISSPEEERRLASSRYRQKVARAIMQGVRGYFTHYAPPDTYLARKHGLLSKL
ncbi:MAG: N-acetylmuramoyl-L-alanine amidase, partial [Pseudomonadota bacterium]